MNNEIVIALIQSTPVALVLLAFIFSKDLRVLMRNGSIHSVSIAGNSIQLDYADTKKTINYFINAMNEVIKIDEWNKFSKIVSGVGNGNIVLVSSIFDEPYERENKNFKVMRGKLRALRGFGLIEPQIKGKWKNDSAISLTKFGKYFSKHKEFQKILTASKKL
jgi:hypothetical protein